MKYAVTDYDDDFISALIMESLTLKPYSDRGFTKDNAELNLDRALELADLIYTTDLDKIYFLKQYIKDGQNLSLDEDEMKKPLRLTK